MPLAVPVASSLLFDLFLAAAGATRTRGDGVKVRDKSMRLSKAMASLRDLGLGKTEGDQTNQARNHTVPCHLRASCDSYARDGGWNLGRSVISNCYFDQARFNTTTHTTLHYFSSLTGLIYIKCMYLGAPLFWGPGAVAPLPPIRTGPAGRSVSLKSRF